MLSVARPGHGEWGPWNPGISSELPAALLPLSTILRPEHVFTIIAEAQELRDFTGLPLGELVAFRPHRLAVHELLIRVTADLSVPDGPRQEDLGINFRRMVENLFERHIVPLMPKLERAYADLKRQLTACIDAEIEALISAPGEAPARGLQAVFLLGRRRKSAARQDDPWAREQRILGQWTNDKTAGDDPLKRAARLALAKTVSAIRIGRPQTRLDRGLVTSIATTLACNDYGSETLGRLIDPVVREAALAEGYRLLPAQERPVVMNTKGASASGKSTMRPLQKKLAGEIGVAWDDFALISPDIWRKYLLDYDSLGDAYKYAGTFTGLEMEVIHHKLDRYMAQKAERGNMSHLLIDRFRFDSFAPDSDEAGSNLLTRFGHLVYLFFMITPPHATVERAWKRGLEVGRFKAVDDLLAHNVEAFTGMPDLFFTWALRENKLVHYEFLDNSVALGERPRTAAFGWNGEMNILDVKCMLDVDRYRKINVDAGDPQAVYPDRSRMAAENNVEFLTQCAHRLPVVNFVKWATGRIYLRLESGRLAWVDTDALAGAAEDPETRAGIHAVAPEALKKGQTTEDSLTSQPPGSTSAATQRAPQYLEADRFHTLGAWGKSQSR